MQFSAAVAVAEYQWRWISGDHWRHNIEQSVCAWTRKQR